MWADRIGNFWEAQQHQWIPNVQNGIYISSCIKYDRRKEGGQEMLPWRSRWRGGSTEHLISCSHLTVSSVSLKFYQTLNQDFSPKPNKAVFVTEQFCHKKQTNIPSFPLNLKCFIMSIYFDISHWRQSRLFLKSSNTDVIMSRALCSDIWYPLLCCIQGLLANTIMSRLK